MAELSAQLRGRLLLLNRGGRSLDLHGGQLRHAGWQVIPALDEQAALWAVRANPVDLVLAEGEDEQDRLAYLAEALRLACGVAYLPLVVISPNPDQQCLCRLLDSGADEVVAPDISPTELDARLRRLMRVKRLQDELRSNREALAASLERERALLARLKNDNEHLVALAGTDPLTRLQNVRHLDAFLTAQFRIARRYNRELSVLVMDLDHFKRVNDVYGHPAGDLVLREFSDILRRLVRESDFVARIGGEEFAIVMPNTDRGQARGLAQRIGQTVAEHCFAAFGQEIRITVSVGMCSYPQDAEVASAQMLLYFADQALLRAKQMGRDRSVGFDHLAANNRRQLRQRYLSRPATAASEMCDVRR